MKRILLTLAVAMLPATALAETQTYFGFQVGITNAPAATHLAFHEAPDCVRVPGTRVSMIDMETFEHDGFFLAGQWYVYRGRYWYRAATYRGPFVVIDVRTVPRAILEIPKEKWKRHPHGGPPGLAKKRRGPDVMVAGQGRKRY